MLRQVIDFFGAKVNNILEDNTQLDEKTTTKTTKSRATNRRVQPMVETMYDNMELNTNVN